MAHTNGTTTPKLLGTLDNNLLEGLPDSYQLSNDSGNNGLLIAKQQDPGSSHSGELLDRLGNIEPVRTNLADPIPSASDGAGGYRTTYQFTSSSNGGQLTTNPATLAGNSVTQFVTGTGDYRLDALLGGSKWNQRTITYGFGSGLSSEIRVNVRKVLDTLERFINLDFVEAQGTVDMHYGFTDDDDDRYAYAHFPEDGGDVFLNPDFDNANNTNGFQGGEGTHGFQAIIHETLHALGLKHTGHYNAGSGSGAAPFLPYGEDNFDNTVMTYNFAGSEPSTPMPYDILALQYLYGAKTYNEVNTTYIFDKPWGFSDGSRYWGMATSRQKVALWDSGGIDTLDFSNLGIIDPYGYRFDLNPGGMLSIRREFQTTTYQAEDESLPGGKTTESYLTTEAGTAIAYGVTIENVIGSIIEDEIIGNQANNILRGQGGYDTINGGLGDDTIDGGSGGDVLSSRVVFSPATVGLSGEFTPFGGGWTSFNQYPRQLADVNGDGRSDIVGFGQDTVYVSFGQAGGTFSAPIVGLSGEFTPLGGGWTSFNQYPRQLADVNGDGRADIVGFGLDTVYVSLGQANGTFSGFITGVAGDFTVNGYGWTSFDQYPRELADVNGDGRADIVGFGQDTVYIALGQTNGTFGQAFAGLGGGFTPLGGGWTSFDQYPRKLADVNGDGRADIIGFGLDTVYVSLGQANGTFGQAFAGLSGEFTPLGGGWASFNQYPRQVADINADGRADIVGFGKDGVYVAYGQADGTFAGFGGGLSNEFAPFGGGWTSFDQFPRELADVDGDGRADIVGFGQDTVYVALAGRDGNDSLDGGTGNDTLDGGTGNNTLVGGLGNDVVLYGRKYSDYQTTFTSNGEVQITSVDGTDLLTGIEQINFINGWYKVYTGDAGNNTLTAADPNSWSMMFGGNGNDSLKSGNGNDSLVGGLGNDTLMGLLGNDILDGGDDQDSLDGGDGNDTLFGGAGNDYLQGRAGADQMFGGIGDDKYFVDQTADVVTEYASEGTDTIVSSVDYVLSANVENLTLVDAAVNGTGNDLGNYILGNAIANYIFASDGNDIVNGRGGNDYVHGGAGNDTLHGDIGEDYLYGATGNDLFYGGEGNDTLLGDAGNDFFYGQAGDDILIGGSGNDTLYGGLGVDKFRFDLQSEGIDIIKDFNRAEGDKIEIFNLSFGAASLNQFSYNSTTGALFFGATQLAVLENKPVGFSVQTDILLV